MGIYVIVKDNEMLISSKLLLLKYKLLQKGITHIEIIGIDNGSNDRTAEVMHSSGFRVVKHNTTRSLERNVEEIKKQVEKYQHEIIVVLDGNSSVEIDTVVELIVSFLDAKKKPGMGYISEVSDEEIVNMNCLIFLAPVFQQISIKGSNIRSEEHLISFGRSMGLNVEARKPVFTRDSKESHLQRIPLKSAWDLINQYKKTYPLRYYGFISLAFFVFALAPGIYEINYMMKYTHLNYPSFFLTVVLGGIGMVSLSLGLIMNALKVLSDKVRGMM